MKILRFLIILSVLFMAKPVFAGNTEVFSQVYYEVYHNCIDKIELQPFAIKTLKSITDFDKKVRIADDKDRLSLYFDAKVVKSYPKPKKENDVIAWGKLSAQIFNDAVKSSKVLADRDFMLIDDILKKNVEELGHDHKYYSGIDMAETKKSDIRYFAERLTNDIMYLKIGEFNYHTRNKVEDAILDNPNLKGLILDLRGNKGGNLSSALDVVDLFMDDGILLSTTDRNGQTTYYNATKGDLFKGKPIIIIVDGDTASSAEAVTLSLQSQGRAKVIGTTTFGKGTVQSLVNLANDSVLSLTTAEFSSPTDDKVNGVGISPDICVSEDCIPQSRAAEEIDIYTATKTLESL